MKHEIKDTMFIYCTLILIFWFISSTFQFNKEINRLNSELSYTNTISAELYADRENYIVMLDSMNKYADSLEKELQQYKYLEKFKKDLDRSARK